MTDWKKLILDNYEALEEAGKTAYRMAWENRIHYVNVELTENGDVFTWMTNIPNAHKESELKGESIQVISFCQKYEEISGDETECYFCEIMEEQGRSLELEKLKNESEENGCHSLLEFLYKFHDGEYIKELELADKQYIEWDIEEYGEAQVDDMLETCIEQYQKSI